MLVEDLNNIFQFLKDGDNLIELNNLISDLKGTAVAIRDNGWYGVAIEIPINFPDYYEKCESIILQTKFKFYSNINHKIIELITDKKELSRNFARICEDFLITYKNNGIEKIYSNSESEWFEKWKKLMGNVMKNETNYSLLAELLVFNYLLKKDNTYTMSKQGTHDIESNNDSVEVKSTIERYKSEIHINSQYQLERNNGKELRIFFVRLEESLLGYSIEDIIEELKNNGYSIEEIMYKISNISTKLRREKYRILESKVYNVDDKFPQIINNSFKENKLPEGISKIEYIVDLSDLKNNEIDLNF